MADKPQDKPQDEPEDKPEDKPVKPKCGRCMDMGFVVETYITDEGSSGSHTMSCSH